MISEAIIAAQAGDTIVVDSGTYAENLYIDKALTLTGRNTGHGRPIIDGSGNEYAIEIVTENVAVNGFNVTNAGYGIEIFAGSDTVNGNYIYGCSGAGIMLADGAVYNTLTLNNVTGNEVGVYLYTASYNNISSNNISNNAQGFELRYSDYNNISGNKICDSAEGGISFNSCNYNNVTGNTIDRDLGGIYTYSSYENNFAVNSLSGNTNGITLDGSNGVLTGNVLAGNSVGIYLKYCSDTVLWLNRLSNTQNFKIDGTGTNYWNSSTLRGYDYNVNHFVSYIGNYWSDYSGTDSNSNGIIDTPRQLASGNADKYPILLAFPAITTPETPVYRVHNTRTGQGYDTISAAIVASQAGDTILVDSGTYGENVIVNKTLTLTGIDTGSGRPIVDGLNGVSAISITANDAVVQGFTATHATTGIDIWGINATVKGNNASNNAYFGIYAEYESKLNNITGNVANENTNGYGIGIAGLTAGPAYNNVSGNTVRNNNQGINCGLCSNSTISDNIASNNAQYGIFLSSSSNNTLARNTVNSNSYAGIYLNTNCNNNTITGNNVSLNGNDYNSHTAGIILNGQCNDNRLTANNASYNLYNGVYLQNANKGNVLWLNVLKGNYQNAASDYVAGYKNCWNSSTPIEYTYNGHVYTNYTGNFWGDYTGVDTTGDGIGDTPYETGSFTDNYPMTYTSSLPQPAIAFTASSVTADEGTTFHIMLHRSGDRSDYSYVIVSYVGGTAIRGVNYTFTNVTITFEADQADSGFDVGLPANTVIESVGHLRQFQRIRPDQRRPGQPD